MTFLELLLTSPKPLNPKPQPGPGSLNPIRGLGFLVYTLMFKFTVEPCDLEA